MAPVEHKRATHPLNWGDFDLKAIKIKQNKRKPTLQLKTTKNCKIGHLQFDSQKVGRDENRIHVYLRSTFNIITEHMHSIYSRVDKGASCTIQGLWYESQVVIFS